MGIAHKIEALSWWRRWLFYAIVFYCFVFLVPLGLFLSAFDLDEPEPKRQPPDPVPDPKFQLASIEQILARIKEIEEEFKQAKERGWT